MKVCTKCKVEKPKSEFSKDSNSKTGLRCSCKKCNSLTKKIYHKKNRNKLIEYSKEYYKNNKDKSKEYYKNYRNNNKDKIAEYNKKYIKNWIKENKDKIAEYRLKNKDKIADYRLKNKKKYIEYTNKWSKKKTKEDSLYRFKLNTRSLIYKSFKRGLNNFVKSSKTEEILGCTIQEFICFIENKFTDGMSLKNYGEWHLDHIHPVSLAKNEEDLIKLNHYTNFQPLWAKDNRIKSNRIINN